MIRSAATAIALLFVAAAPAFAQTPMPQRAPGAPAAQAPAAPQQDAPPAPAPTGSPQVQPSTQSPPPSPAAAAAAAKVEADGKAETDLVLACKQRALSLLKQRSPSIEDIFIDMDGITVAKADLAVEDTKITMVVMGEAYIQRDQSDKVHRFLCLAGEGGKVLLTFFTQR
ncbi:hypothetical protein [Aquabacter spiritensis]|uniref:Uncharacterized protein n=1 Tax=Aquabacter spiritensis TaxID=933073 RepID=A0A4R3LZI7_9HYPH|nr:hypothetical protein [Aquabacter spiritensis]TCT04187.1 hypothetical protein EDC64_1072 [Aquabacter spiritensis]